MWSPKPYHKRPSGIKRNNPRLMDVDLCRDGRYSLDDMLTMKDDEWGDGGKGM